jgi:membrane-associated phospholipid phosphatase
VSSQNADIELLRSINLERNSDLDPAFRFITNSVTPVSIGAPATVLFSGWIMKDSAVVKKGLILAEGLIVSGFITAGLKYSVRRTRPFVTYPDLEQVVGAGSPSFPSGHTSAAFETATALSIAFPKWYVIAPSFCWAAAAGYSRMDLGVHYPSDVLAGAVVGSGCAYLTWYLNKRLNKTR